MQSDEGGMCKLCPTTEEEQGTPLTWVDWLEAGVCRRCAHFFGISVEGEKSDG